MTILAAEFQGTTDQHYGHITYSQNGEDLLFAALFDRMGIARPSYLDVGANNPLACSNTALLYRRGSRGVNIDASPDAIQLFAEQRPDDTNVNVGVGAANGDLTFYRIDAYSGRNSFSRAVVDQFIAENPIFRITDQIVVPVITLDRAIATYCGGKYPDLLSIDAEGLDLDILAAASFANRPKILCVEGGEQDEPIEALLTERGFRMLLHMGANAIYVDRDAKL
jgi:FkbM family methyltransferase